MPTTNLTDPIALDAQHVLQIYRRAPVVFESGSGCALFTRSGERYIALQAELATRLSGLTGLPRAFFCNSGAEAVEACLKFARRFWHAQGTPRASFVAFDHSFHGRTMGAVSVTWDTHYREQR
jgi:acetylornithine/succinyldiaminopimelate/putrescine aminotransferase